MSSPTVSSLFLFLLLFLPLLCFSLEHNHHHLHKNDDLEQVSKTRARSRLIHEKTNKAMAKIEQLRTMKKKGFSFCFLSLSLSFFLSFYFFPLWVEGIVGPLTTLELRLCRSKARHTLFFVLLLLFLLFFSFFVWVPGLNSSCPPDPCPSFVANIFSLSLFLPSFLPFHKNISPFPFSSSSPPLHRYRDGKRFRSPLSYFLSST